MHKLLKALLFIPGILATVVLGVLALIYILSPKFDPPVYEPFAPDYWQTEGFRISTLEEQGMDSEKLLEMLDLFEEQCEGDQEIAIDSITIVRNGYLGADFYINPLYPIDMKDMIHSCIKRIISALIGITIEQGYIEGVQAPVIDR